MTTLYLVIGAVVVGVFLLAIFTERDL